MLDHQGTGTECSWIRSRCSSYSPAQRELASARTTGASRRCRGWTYSGSGTPAMQSRVSPMTARGELGYGRHVAARTATQEYMDEDCLAMRLVHSRHVGLVHSIRRCSSCRRSAAPSTRGADAGDCGQHAGSGPVVDRHMGLGHGQGPWESTWSSSSRTAVAWSRLSRVHNLAPADSLVEASRCASTYPMPRPNSRW